MAFCRKCGAQIPDDSAFCTGCGASVAVPEEQGRIVPVQSDRNVEVSVENIRKMGITQTSFSDRIEASSDKEVNDHLFTLYSKLVPPVQEIERLSAKMDEDTTSLNEAKSFTFVPPLVPVIIVAAIVVFVMFFYRAQPLEKKYKADPQLQSMYENDNLYIREKAGIFYRPLADALVEGKVFMMLFGWPLIYGLVISVIFSIIAMIVIFISDKNKIPKLEKALADAEMQRAQIVAKIRDYICYVPPSYRYSSAISHFVDSYRNTRASNLQEAVREYDTYIRDKNLQESIASMEANICDALGVIAARQLETQEQLSAINASVWVANFMF